MRLFALALLLLLASAAPAGAAVTSEVIDGALIVQGDEEANGVELTVEGGRIAVNGTATALVANANARIVVDSFAGADRVDADTLLADQYANLVFTGGEGDDLLTGGDRSDLLIWNEDDGDDTSTGGDGNDGVLVIGDIVAADVLSFGPAPVGGTRRADPDLAKPFRTQFRSRAHGSQHFRGQRRDRPRPRCPDGDQWPHRTDPPHG